MNNTILVKMILMSYFTVSIANVPSIVGFTTIQECIEQDVSIKFLLRENSEDQFVACFPYAFTGFIKGFNVIG